MDDDFFVVVALGAVLVTVVAVVAFVAVAVVMPVVLNG